MKAQIIQRVARPNNLRPWFCLWYGDVHITSITSYRAATAFDAKKVNKQISPRSVNSIMFYSITYTIVFTYCQLTVPRKESHNFITTGDTAVKNVALCNYSIIRTGEYFWFFETNLHYFDHVQL